MNSTSPQCLGRTSACRQSLMKSDNPAAFKVPAATADCIFEKTRFPIHTLRT